MKAFRHSYFFKVKCWMLKIHPSFFYQSAHQKGFKYILCTCLEPLAEPSIWAKNTFSKEICRLISCFEPYMYALIKSPTENMFQACALKFCGCTQSCAASDFTECIDQVSREKIDLDHFSLTVYSSYWQFLFFFWWFSICSLPCRLAEWGSTVVIVQTFSKRPDSWLGLSYTRDFSKTLYGQTVHFNFFDWYIQNCQKVDCEHWTLLTHNCHHISCLEKGAGLAQTIVYGCSHQPMNSSANAILISDSPETPRISFRFLKGTRYSHIFTGVRSSSLEQALRKKNNAVDPILPQQHHE